MQTPIQLLTKELFQTDEEIKGYAGMESIDEETKQYALNELNKKKEEIQLAIGVLYDYERAKAA